MSAPELVTLSETYRSLWEQMSILEPRKAGCVSAAHRCVAAKSRYQTVADKLGLPKATGWAFIALIHYREANCNFHCHLHNGDPLTSRTTHVPAGRPLEGDAPFTWEESAVDALRMRGLASLAGQLTSLEGFAYGTEGFNGWGYFWHDKASPYLWAGTNACPAGKYRDDHVYDPELVDPQEGALAVLQVLMSIDPTITFAGLAQAPVSRPTSPIATSTATLTQDAASGSWTHTIALLISTLTGMCTAFSQAFEAIRPYLQNPAVVAALLVALAGAGFIVWREHRAALTA